MKRRVQDEHPASSRLGAGHEVQPPAPAAVADQGRSPQHDREGDHSDPHRHQTPHPAGGRPEQQDRPRHLGGIQERERGGGEAGCGLDQGVVEAGQAAGARIQDRAEQHQHRPEEADAGEHPACSRPIRWRDPPPGDGCEDRDGRPHATERDRVDVVVADSGKAAQHGRHAEDEARIDDRGERPGHDPRRWPLRRTGEQRTGAT